MVSTRLTPGVCIVMALFLSSGCDRGPALPKTYPAKGLVLYREGKPLDGGVVLFTPVTDDDPLLRISGEIQQDGSFVLRTMKDSSKQSGAPAGEYKVVIQLPMEEVMIGDRKIRHKGVPPIVLTQTYTVEPNENTLRIEVPAPPGS